MKDHYLIQYGQNTVNYWTDTWVFTGYFKAWVISICLLFILVEYIFLGKEKHDNYYLENCKRQPREV